MRVMAMRRDQGVKRDLVFGQRGSEFIHSAASYHMVAVPSRAGPDFGFARVMSVFNSTVGVASAQPLFRRPGVEGIVPVPRQNWSNDGMHGRLRIRSLDQRRKTTQTRPNARDVHLQHSLTKLAVAAHSTGCPSG